MSRKYNLSFAELIDRLTIVIQKIVFSENDEMRKSFVEERNDIIHDLNLFINNDGVTVDGELISRFCYLQLVNATIWANEGAARGDGEEKNYELTHGLNSDRATIKKSIQQQINGRIDYKLNYGFGYWNMEL